MASLTAVTQVVEKIQDTYENWTPRENTINVWVEYLSDIDDEVFIEALDKYIEISISQFPPSLPVLIAISAKIQEVNKTIFEMDNKVLIAGKL